MDPNTKTAGDNFVDEQLRLIFERRLKMANQPAKAYNERISSRRQRLSLPHRVDFQYDLNERHNTKISDLSKSEEFWTDKLLSRLKCHRNDVYEDVEGEEPTYVYALNYCPLQVCRILLLSLFRRLNSCLCPRVMKTTWQLRTKKDGC